MKPRLRAIIREEIKAHDQAEPLAKQLLFDQKVKEATESLKEFATKEIKRIEKEKTLFWKLLGTTFFLLNVILLFASPCDRASIFGPEGV